jgi:alpha-N-arabinofuranosidase
MRACKGIVLFGGVLAISGILGCASAGEISGKPFAVTVDAGQKGEPINPFIYGQFIEHLGRCIYGGIWAEMLEDRKFYHPVTDDYNPYGGRNMAYPVVKASPWEVLGPAGSVTMVKAGSFVGEHTPKVASGSGLRQRDLGVVAGKEYVGYVWLKAGGKAGPVEVALAWGEGAGDRQAVAIPAVGDAYAKHPLAFKAGATTDQAMLEIRAKGGAVLVGTASLMPADHVGGMRADTLKLLRELNAPMYRWPGGNFVSGYDWRDGIGDRDRRPPRKNPAWTGVEHNDVGIDEFIAFCRAVKAEPVIAVNTGFGDHYSAAQEVEYCNGTAETIGGGWRAKYGHPEPYGVKYWCVGNEMYGAWQLGFMQLRHYTIKHNLVADAMRKADPAISLIGVGDLGRVVKKDDKNEKRGWSRGMLERCAERMEYISEHFYRGRKPWDPEKPETLVQHVAMLRDSIRQKAEGHRALQAELPNLKGRRVPIAMDEWNYWHRPYVYGELGCVYDLADGLGVAAGLHEYFRHSDIIHMAHYAQTVNVIGCIKTSRTAAGFATTALPLMLYRRHYGVVPLAVAGEHAPLDVAAALTRDGGSTPRSTSRRR